jgi:hypothetical protein
MRPLVKGFQHNIAERWLRGEINNLKPEIGVELWTGIEDAWPWTINCTLTDLLKLVIY